MNFMFNTGSVLLPIIPVMAAFQLLCKFIHFCTRKGYRYKWCRWVGCRIYRLQNNFSKVLLTFIIGAFFDLHFSFVLQIYQMIQNSDNLKEWYFKENSDLIQSILTIIFGFILYLIVLLDIYVHYKYGKMTEEDKKVVKENYLAFYSDLRLASGSVYGLIFKINRIIVIYNYVFLAKLPLFQLYILTYVSLFELIYLFT